MTHQNDTYKVWAADNMMYGPIDFATLREWVSEDRILSDTWIHSERTNAWYHAREIDALRPHLHSRLPVTREEITPGDPRPILSSAVQQQDSEATSSSAYLFRIYADAERF